MFKVTSGKQIKASNGDFCAKGTVI